MKIKNRNVSFLALSLTGVISLASLEGVYAGDNGESQKIELSKEKKKGAYLKDVSAKKAEKLDKKLEASKADEKFKGEATKSRSEKKEEEKFTVVESKDDQIKLMAPDGMITTIETKAGKVTSQDFPAMAAMMELLAKGNGFEDVSAKFRFSPSVIEKDPKLFKYLIGKEFHSGVDGSYGGSVYGSDIEEVIMRTPFGTEPMKGGMGNFTVELNGLSPEIARGLTEGILSEHFFRRRDEIILVMKVIQPMVDYWENGRGPENYFSQNSEIHFEDGMYGNMLLNDGDHAIMTDAELGMRAWKDMGEYGQEVPSKFNLTMLASPEAVDFGRDYSLTSTIFAEGGRLSYDVPQAVINDIVEKQPNMPAGATAAFSYDNVDSFQAMVAFMNNNRDEMREKSKF